MLQLHPLHSQILEVGQQQVLSIVDIALLTFLKGLSYSHPHHLHSKTSLAADCQHSRVYVFQCQPFHPLHDTL